jgi:phage repressor protein C with HTH and peptisase S24 domain
MTVVPAALLPWQFVLVRGVSMLPTLREGDRVLVRHGARIRPGDVVLARFADLPDRLVLKRAERRVAGGWWVGSDNAAVGGDSGTHGPAEVLARVVARLPEGAYLPRRICRIAPPS